MLQILDIRKKYVTGELVQTALDGVSLNLRDNEFVAILGPSGSGKTTLLNVVGGLDRYDSGDLIINGISTKKYSDRDWDSYRNHTIGFVFQSYNLIPHQSVLANVELALTISGISRGERRRRAAKALADVGLGDQLHKKPNQMSGGQMQRVAIARALVNDPDILLADEPTGALDSETSVQVMELLKEVSRDRLVVMVTHNPELAEEYANRIVRVRDGRIMGDTNPYTPEKGEISPPQHKNMGRSSMSYFTALNLSFNNLRTKLARTLLTSFAGSIGIIGIALIMSLSTGFQKYIDKIQADTLSNYPLTIQSETADMTSAFMAFGTSMAEANQAPEGTVVEQQMITQMFAQVGSNDLASFKTHLEENYQQIGHTITDIKYSYGISPRIYLRNRGDTVMQANPATLFDHIMGNSMMTAYMVSDVFYEMIGNRELLDSQYDVIRGRWPESYDELIVVLSDPNQITDYMAYTLGLKDQKILEDIIDSAMRGEQAEEEIASMKWNYEDLMGLDLRLVNVPDLYCYNAEYGVWEDMSDDKAFMEDCFQNGLPLKVVGIVCPKEGVSATALSEGLAYTGDLTRYVIEHAEESEIVRNQLDNPKLDVFTGTGFDEEKESKLNFENMISVDANAISSAFGMNLSEDAIMDLLKNYIADISGSLRVDTTPAQQAFVSLLAELGKGMLSNHVQGNMNESGAAVIRLADIDAIVDGYLSTSDATSRIQTVADQYSMAADDFRQVCRPLLVALVTDYVADALSGNQNQTPEPPAAPEETQPIHTPDATVPAETEEPSGEEPVPAPTDNIPEDEQTQPIVETVPAAEQPAATDPAKTEPEAAAPVETQPVDREPEETRPAPDPGADSPSTDLEIELDPDMFSAEITMGQIDGVVSNFILDPMVTGTAGIMGTKMMIPTVRDILQSKISGFGNVLSGFIGNAFYVDGDKIANAFQFNMTEEDIQRLMSAMSGQNRERSTKANLRALGYARLEEPTGISIYLTDFAGKEEFLAFLDGYNADMQAEGQEEQVIRYTDLTGVMMSSVRTIIDSVSYALIAFVAVSLVVSSIMIGIITYISVMERTKEIGVLRAIGASKRNISQVFNAETFIIGFCSGLIGIGITLLLLIPGNMVIQHLTENPDIVAQLPVMNGVVLILLSMMLTLIGGFIPAKKAAKKDPVIALRSE